MRFFEGMQFYYFNIFRNWAITPAHSQKEKRHGP
jgi:hypothetical protein